MTELEQIIQRMIDAGESEENIKIVIQNYQADQVKQAKQAEPVKTEAVATETVPVTAENKTTDTGLKSQGISLEQFDTMSPAEKRKLSYRDKQRLIHERGRRDKGGLDSFDVSSNDYSKLEGKERIRIQEEASKELAKKYKKEGVVDFKITPEQIDKEAAKLLKEKTQPSLLESYAAQTVRGFAGFIKNSSEFATMLDYSLTEAALSAFDDQWEGTPEQKQALMNVKKFSINGLGPLSAASQNFISTLEPSIREYETQTIIEDLENGDYLQAGQRAVGAALESIPSIVAASYGIGGIVALGASSAGGKFDEEFGKDPSTTTGTLVANALATGAVEAGFELVTRGILRRSGILVDNGMKKAAEDLIRGGSEKLLAQYGINTVGEAGSEAATKATTLVVDSLPKWIGGLDKEVEWSKEWRGIMDEGIVGSVFGISSTTAGGIKNRNVNAVAAAESILMPQDGKQAIIKSANKISELHKDRIVADTEGVIILDKAIRAEIINIEEIKRINSKALGNMKPEEIKAYASNNTRIDKLKSIVNKPNQVESVKEIAEQDLKDLTKANNILFQESGARRLTENIEVAGEITSKLGFKEKPQVFETTESYLTAIKDAGFDSSEAEGSDGVFIGKGKIFIDKTKALEVGAVSVGTHEVLHPILNALIGDYQTQGRVVSEFKKSLSADQVDYVQRRLDANVPRDRQDTEFINYFSDGIIKKEIKYNENVFQKIKEFLIKTFNRQGFENVDFKKGEDVYKFLKEYNKGALKNKVSDKTVKQIKTGETVSGVKASEVDVVGGQQASKSIADLNTELEELIDNEYEMDEGDFESQKSNLELKIRQAKAKEAKPVAEVSKKPTVKKEGSTKEKAVSSKVYNNESLVETIKSKDSTTREKAKAEADLVDSFDSLALKAIKYDTRKGDYDREDVRDYLREFLPGIIERYDPSESKFSTYVTNTIAPKAQQTYEKFRKIADKSIDAEIGGVGSVKEMSGDINTLYGSDTEFSGLKESTQKMIKATSFGPISDPVILEAVENVIEVKESERPNFKSLNNKYFDKVSEAIFGINGKKTRGNASLKYDKSGGSSEANSLQNVFKNDNDVKKFIKTMPDYNIATKETVVNEQGEIIDVSRDTYGRSIGINPKVLAIFYDKVEGAIPGISSPNGRSLGLTTQTDVYKLKPEFTGNISPASVAKLQSLIGINKGTLSIPIKGEARTEFGSILTGLTKMYIDNVINTVGRSKLDTNQAKADLGCW